MRVSKRGLLVFVYSVSLLIPPTAHGGVLRTDKLLLLCHRTANRDVPENTLESLALAARMGCNVVEVDVRRTADGKLVLNHDGYLDRFTDRTGEVETTDLRELDRMDFGEWMGRRFAGMQIAHFEDALRLAREMNVDLDLDIKTKGIGAEVLAVLEREQMMGHVIFGGEWDDIKQLAPSSNSEASAWLQPGFTHGKVEELHKENKVVIANFILNGHEFDLRGMKEAVAFGVDGIMVDYPRLGAIAVGRPVEERIRDLSTKAISGATEARVEAIRELSHFTGFPLERQFFRWLFDPDEAVSHEAAAALVSSRPTPSLESFRDALRSQYAATRRSSAWAVSSLVTLARAPEPCAVLLMPLVHDPDMHVVEEALIGLSRCPPDHQHVSPEALKAALTAGAPVIRGLAADALARHFPAVAAVEVPQQLERDEDALNSFNARWTTAGRPKLSEQEIDKTVELYRAQMKEIRALGHLPGSLGSKALAMQAFREGHDYSMTPILVSGFDIWDRLSDDPGPAMRALQSTDSGVADWAEWCFVKSGPGALPAVRNALRSSHGEFRRRLIEIVAWQADVDAIPLLQQISTSSHDDAERELTKWAISTINDLDVKAPAAP